MVPQGVNAEGTVQMVYGELEGFSLGCILKEYASRGGKEYF
jgi:hypothetical protein